MKLEEREAAEELIVACASLREELDCDKYPGLIGSPVEVVLQAKDDIKALKAEVEQLKAHYESALQNWNFVLDERDKLQQEVEQLRFAKDVS